MTVRSPGVIGVFRLEHGLNIYAHICEIIENPHNRVAKLHGYPLRLARALFLAAAGLSVPVANAGVFALCPGDRTRPIYERVSLAVLLDGLLDFRVYHNGDLRERDTAVIPPVRDRVLMYCFCKFVYRHFLDLLRFFGLINNPSFR